MIEAVLSGLPADSLIQARLSVAVVGDEYEVHVSDGLGTVRAKVEVALGELARDIHDRVIHAVGRLTLGDMVAVTPYKAHNIATSDTVTGKAYSVLQNIEPECGKIHD